MATVLAQQAAQPVVAGPGSIGPFPVPAGSAGLQLLIDRATLPNLAPLLSIVCQASYDGGASYAPMGGGGIDGGDIPARSGGTLTQSALTFAWKTAPTHVRIDVDSQAAFSVGFSVSTV